jgi:hypothetical protein
MRTSIWLILLLAPFAAAQQSGETVPVPVILDTDIGTDIDDAYALAALLNRPELHLLGVTTVSGDAVARARLAAKLLQVAGGESAKIPVFAGTSGSTQYMKQVEWAEGFASPNLHSAGGVEFMRREVNARPGENHADRHRRAHQCRSPAQPRAWHRQEDSRDLADGWVCLSWLFCRFETRTRVEHPLERGGSAHGIQLGSAIVGGASRLHSRTETDPANARTHFLAWHAPQRRSRGTRRDMALHQRLERRCAYVV